MSIGAQRHPLQTLQQPDYFRANPSSSAVRIPSSASSSYPDSCLLAGSERCRTVSWATQWLKRDPLPGFWLSSGAPSTSVTTTALPTRASWPRCHDSIQLCAYHLAEFFRRPSAPFCSSKAPRQARMLHRAIGACAKTGRPFLLLQHIEKR